MSNTEHLTATMTVDRPAIEVYAAITNVRGWWSENIIGDTATVHDEFVLTEDSQYAGETVVAKEGIRFCRFRVTEAVPGERMAWHVVDSVLTFIDDQDEWTGTDVVFELTTGANGTTLDFTHNGLTADSECFDACSGGWTFYITRSLPQLITTGNGRPMPKYDVR